MIVVSYAVTTAVKISGVMRLSPCLGVRTTHVVSGALCDFEYVL